MDVLTYAYACVARVCTSSHLHPPSMSPSQQITTSTTTPIHPSRPALLYELANLPPEEGTPLSQTSSAPRSELPGRHVRPILPLAMVSIDGWAGRGAMPSGGIEKSPPAHRLASCGAGRTIHMIGAGGSSQGPSVLHVIAPEQHVRSGSSSWLADKVDWGGGWPPRGQLLHASQTGIPPCPSVTSSPASPP